jgi:PAS domain S-box-containing protein
VLVTLAAGFGTLYLISYLFQYRDKPGSKWFILTLVGQSIFCFAYAIGLTVFDRTLRLALEILSFIGLSWLGVPFLAFALAYTGRGEFLETWYFKILLAFPIASTLLFPFNSWHNLVWTDFEIEPVFGVATASYSFQPLAFFGILGAGVVVGMGAALLFDTVLSYGPLYRKEALAVALSPVPPIAGMFPWVFGFGPTEPLNTVAIGLLPHVLLDMYAFVGSGMFEFHPATNRAAERSAIDDLRSPVLILEEDGRIVDLNRPAEELLGLERAATVTKPLSAILDGELQPTDLTDSTDDHRLSLRHDGQRLEFLVRPSPLTDSGGNHVGYTLLFQNITETIQREERLSVLNRVLRHNLRNDLTVIQGYVDEAKRQSDNDTVGNMLDNAGSKTDELVSAGAMAREIEQTIGSGDITRTTVQLPDLLEQVAGAVEREYPRVAVTVDCDVDAIETDADVLESVLEQLVDNAVAHDRSDSADVTLRATTAEDSLETVIEDTGPGIPDHEVETLKQGEETALEHGSGLGLWLVKWGVMRLGGDIEFETDGEGTTVRVTLPLEMG